MNARRRIGRPGGTADRPALFFRDAAEFRSWLEANHESATELWMGLHKKHVPDRGLTWEQAVPEALCFGWIDSVAQRVDEDSTRQRWTPRKPTSTWSKVNIALVAELTEAGKMRPAGLAAYERRRPERSGIYSFERDGMPELPAAYAAQLADSADATTFWGFAPPGYRKQVIHWVLDAKQEATRDRRMTQLLDDSVHGRLVPPQRYGEPPGWVGKARVALGLPAHEDGT